MSRHHRRVEQPRWVLTPQRSTTGGVPPASINFNELMEMDLIYGDDNGDSTAVPEIMRIFPSVKIVDASDFIHEGRVFVEMGGKNITKDQWYRFLIERGMTGISLAFELDRMTVPKAILAWLKTWRSSVFHGAAR